MNIPREVTAAGPGAEWIYQEAISKGNSPRMAEMLALRKAPSPDTDDTFLAGRGTLLKQFDGDERAMNARIQEAQRHGYTPGVNDVYMPTLAQFPGDPRAFVRSKGECVRLAEERGTALELKGRQVVKGRTPDRDPMEDRVALAEDLIQESIPEVIRENPKLANDIGEARAAVIDKHAVK